ncbi:MAG: hypothetical protein ABSF57_06120 [Acidobacteriaceae bacterium]|jgi:hypothetical protein
MATKKVSKKADKKWSPTAETALAKYMEENKEIAEALDVMKQAQLIRLRPLSLDRFSYQSVE